MSLSRKTGLAISFTLISLIAILSVLTRLLLIDGFSRLEEADTRQQVSRASAVLVDDLAQLNSTVGDWSAWNDTYAFMLDGNAAYLEANIADSTFTNLRLNMILFVDTSGQVVFGRGFEAQQQQAIPADLTTQLLGHPALWHPTDIKGNTVGIVALPQGVLLAASRPILTNEQIGPSRGTLLFGRWLDAAEIERLSNLAHVSMSVFPWDSSALRPDDQAAQAALSVPLPVSVRPLDDQTIAGYARVTDIDGRPALLLRVTVPRLIHAQGQSTLSYFALSLLAVGVVFSVLMPLLLERLVLARLRRLNTSVKAIESSADPTARVPADGRDELGSLGRTINDMLGALHKSEMTLRLFVENAPAAIAMFDTEMRYLAASRRWSTDYQLGDRPLLGVSHYEVFPEIGENWKAAHRRGLAGAIEYRDDDPFPRAGGSVDRVRWEMRPWYTAENRVGGIILFTEVITHFKRAEQTLRLQSAALQAAANAIVITDRTGQIQWVNPAFTELTGYSSPEALGKNPRELIRSGKQGHAFYRNLWETILAGKTWRGELVNRHKDGHEYSEEMALTPVMTDGEVTHFIAIKQDITARKRHEYELEALVTVAAALRAAPTRGDMLPVIVNQTLSLFQAGGAALMMPDRNTQQVMIVLARGAWAERTGTRMPVNLAELPRFIPLDKPYLNNDVAADPRLGHIGLLGGQNAVACVPLVAAQQMIGLLWIGRTTAITHVDTNLLVAIGEIAASALYRAILIETLERRVNERTRELSAANERLQELDRLKSKFVSDVSHELRTPVTSLSLYGDLLEHGKPEKRDHYVRQLKVQTERLQHMINDILDLSRLESNHDKVELTPLDLNPIVEHVAALQQANAEAAGLQLSCHTADGLHMVLGRPDTLTRAVANLVANAIKYTRAGSVQVRTYAADKRVCVEVTDTGRGIEPDDLRHLFERFYRGKTVAQSDIPGTGLGLAIVKEIAEAHGGTVEVESELGEGSTFRLWLPAVIG